MAVQPEQQPAEAGTRPVEPTAQAEEPHQEKTHISLPTADSETSQPSSTPQGLSSNADDQITPSLRENDRDAPSTRIGLPVEVKRLSSDAEFVSEVRSGTSPSSQSRDSEDSSNKKRLNIRWTSSEDDANIGIHWYYPTTMVFLAVGGFLGAIGHHLYNLRFHGTEALGDTAWPQRWGVALAFFIKMMLGAAVQIAFKQRAWLSIKKRAFKVKTLDSIFHACYDPLEFFDKDLFAGAFIPALLAGLIWLLPLSAIATPSTLTVYDGTVNYTGTCSQVSSLNFARENGFDMNVWNSSLDKNGLSNWLEFDNHTSWFDAPSMDLRRIYNLAMLSSNTIQPNRVREHNISQNPVYVSPLQPENPCPFNSDCAFSLTWHAPSYKCEEREDFGGDKPLNKSQFIPWGDLLYASYSSIEETGSGAQPDWNLTHPDNNTGVWTREPTLWIGYIWNTTVTADEEDAKLWDTTKWPSKYKQYVLECTLYNATYSFDLGFESGVMKVYSGFKIVPEKPLFPEGGEPVRPVMPLYMEHSGFHAVGHLYRTQLSGNLTQINDTMWAVTNSDISQTDVMDPGTAQPHEEKLGPYVEAGFQNIFLSMLSDKKQYAQGGIDIPCFISKRAQIWRYAPLWLAISYFIAVGLTLGAVGVGLHAMVANGYAIQTNFSTFLATTRNSDLDAVVRGSSLGAAPLKREARETSLRFGEMRPEGTAGHDGRAHAAFGFPDQIRTLKKGKKYD